MKKPPPSLHADLAAVARELLERSPAPLNIAKLRSQLPGPYKVPAKLKDAFVALLDGEVAGGRVHAWPAGKYWNRDSRTWAEPAMLEAAIVPVAATKVVGAVSKVYGKPAAEALLVELVGSGSLIRVPLFGGAKAKVCSRIVDEAAFRAELDAAREVIEAGYRRLGVGISAPPVGALSDNGPTDEQILDALADLEPRKGLLVIAPRIYRALAETPKSDIDAALMRLQDARRVILHRHSNPQSQNAAELIDGLYVGACWRVDQ